MASLGLSDHGEGLVDIVLFNGFPLRHAQYARATLKDHVRSTRFSERKPRGQQQPFQILVAAILAILGYLVIQPLKPLLHDSYSTTNDTIIAILYMVLLNFGELENARDEEVHHYASRKQCCLDIRLRP